MEIQTNQPVPSEEPKSKTNLILIILVVVLLLGNAATAYFLLTKPKNEQIENINTTVDVDNENIDANISNATSTDNITQNEDNNFVGLKPLQVVWEKTTTVNAASVIPNYDNLVKYAKTTTYDGMTFDEYVKYLKFYKVGKINNDTDGTYAEYNNADLYVVTAPAGGPSFRPNFYRVIKYYDQILLLSAQSDSLRYDTFMQLFVNHEINNYYLANLGTPNEIAIPNSKYTLVKDNEELKMLLQDFDRNNESKNIFGEVYMARNCFFVKAADGSISIYYLKTDLLDSYNSSQGRASNVFDIKWNDGSKNTNGYGSINGPLGCGGPGCYDIVNYISNEEVLRVVGTSPDGLPIYELKDIDFKASPSDKQSVLQNIYDNNYYPGYDEVAKKPKEKMSFNEFIQSRPLIFYKDPFGHYIRFTNINFMPVAECGKPVIYLYPTKTTTVSVKVNPTGGFSKTEPSYDNGWRVLAEPNGDLYNYADKKTYPYLFWEGYALNYNIPKEGFVIARSEVKKFLEEKLAAQGLNAKESAEFIEFWWPRMQADPYYFVTFVPQSEFDKLAPLEVSPKPDTVIRVFMDYQALSAPIEVSEQKLSAPKRQGFTVVEWGGALHK